MAYRIEYSPTADRILAKMDPQTRRRIIKYMDEQVAPLDNARDYGEQLIDPKFYGHWRYRVGDYRVICDIQDGKLLVLVVTVGKRDKIYNKK